MVYKFPCPKEDYTLFSVHYTAGVTTTFLSLRLTTRLADEAPNEHMQPEHSARITRQMQGELIPNT